MAFDLEALKIIYKLAGGEQYLADQLDQVFRALRLDGWVQEDGSLHVDRERREEFLKDLGGAIVNAIEHG